MDQQMKTMVRLIRESTDPEMIEGRRLLCQCVLGDMHNKIRDNDSGVLPLAELAMKFARIAVYLDSPGHALELDEFAQFMNAWYERLAPPEELNDDAAKDVNYKRYQEVATRITKEYYDAHPEEFAQQNPLMTILIAMAEREMMGPRR